MRFPRLDGVGILLIGVAAFTTITAAIGFSRSPNSGLPNCSEGDCLRLAELATQNNIANAAWAMFSVTAAASVVGLITLIYVLGTWNEARRSADAAQETVVAQRVQTRAHISISEVEYVHSQGGNDGQAYCRITATLKNSGITPARNVRLEVNWRVYSVAVRGGEQLLINRTECTSGTAIASDSQLGVNAYFFRVEGDELIDALVAKYTSLSIDAVVTVHFSDVFGEQHAESANFGTPANIFSPVPRPVKMQRMPG